jgi:cytochrome b561
MPSPRYHRALVALHWISAALILLALFMGTVYLQHIPNSSPDKLFALRAHMSTGGLILLLTLIRLVVRINTAHPEPATTGHAVLDRAAPLAHWTLYILILAMAGSGIALSVQANLPAAVFQGTAALPTDFSTYLPRLGHGVVAKLLMAFITLHVLAALYHQFVRKDGLFSRMSFKKTL